MKLLFILMLVISVVLGLYSGLAYVSGYAHNHYHDRYFALHDDRFAEVLSGVRWVATPKQLSECPAKVAGAYKESVEDAYRSSIVSRDLLGMCLLLAAMLFACSVIGIGAARIIKRGRPSHRWNVNESSVKSL
jgi:hypothetical protein